MPEPVEERVKPCLECGTVIPFDAEMCSLCGAGTKLRSRPATTAAEDEPVKPCLACEALIPADALFCPECGDFTLAVAGASGTVPALGAREGGALAFMTRVVAVLVAASAATLLGWMLVEFARARALVAG